ncbi:sensor domain-containing diguanylate cyclase [Thiocystis violacea]|uniref:GGDEF domain-containing protein n=1 Tax=Thiocystis violacea TaxID=13725 RepID=UPI00190661F5|nr:GGDEF domain-containing protein [Thiocystis violacea]MBK1718149.1 GGDEF domain-containing protein [Thiocystis violacea]
MVKFWKREAGAVATETGTDVPPALDGQGPPSGLERTALDQLASVLRVWGLYAFDVDEIKAEAITEQLERWSRHVLMASPTGDSDAAPDPDKAQARRDWGGLREFVTRVRRGEQAYVNRQILGTRQVMGDFVQTLGQVLAEDQEEQSRVMAVIHKLRGAIEKNAPVEVLTQEAMQAIDLISGIARERSQRHQGLLSDLTNKLQTLRGELDAAQREMELDPLTRLFNRKALDIQLERVFELCKLSGQPACLMMIDADHFKNVNDQHGHPVGDLVLKRLADCCVQGFPRKTDFVARYGGEEFAIVLQDTHSNTGLLLGQRLLEAVREMRIEHEGGTLGITVSIGMAEIEPHASSGQWLRASDSALYEAKKAGRDRIVALRTAA